MNVAKFSYWPIGQGLFYTGQIYQNKKTFNFIYDCGSDNEAKLHEEIDSYISDLGDEDIDLLCISHFDSDHVNGLEHLLNAVDKVNFLVLPYINPEELVLLLPNNPGCLIYTDWGRNRLFPETTFNKVILIADDKSDDNNRNELEMFSDIYGDIEIVSNTEAAKTKNVNRFIKYWMFKFFTYTPKNINLSDKNSFYKILKRIILDAWGINITDRDGMLSWLKLPWNVPEKCVLKEISGKVLYENAREEFKKINNKKFTNNNDMSLICFHEPDNNFKNLLFYTPVYNYKKSFFSNLNATNLGQMLTGDFNFMIDNKQSCVDFERHYQNEIPRIGYMNLSHHGAKINWNPRLLDVIESINWIISFGICNRHGHPHNKPVFDLIKSYRLVVCCNEDMPVDIIYY